MDNLITELHDDRRQLYSDTCRSQVGELIMCMTLWHLSDNCVMQLSCYVCDTSCDIGQHISLQGMSLERLHTKGVTRRATTIVD